jgi:hypothetical protein
VVVRTNREEGRETIPMRDLLNALFGNRIDQKRLAELRTKKPMRRRFRDKPVVRVKENGQGIFAPPFPETIVPLFQAETGLEMHHGPYGPYRFLSDAELPQALVWQEKRSHLIFLRDLLDMSLALDFNLAEVGKYTELGQTEHDAKEGSQAAIRDLVGALATAISDLAMYKDADSVCAIPPSPNKAFDLPTRLVDMLGKVVGKPNISSHVSLTKPKPPLKALSLADRWAALDRAGISVGSDVGGRRIILVDDKYQSGTTIHFVAAKLLEAGAKEIYGISCVKTWRDTDNT